MWEIRGEPRHFTHSRVMLWVALDRGIRGAASVVTGDDRSCTLAARWPRRLHDEICTQGYDAELGSFVQSYGSKALDASLLLLPTTGFLPPNDPRVRGTIEAIERHLVVDGFVLRYDTGTGVDGLPPGEGVFLACSFWFADALVLIGRIDDAQRLFERLLAIRNDVGLLAEEYDPREAAGSSAISRRRSRTSRS